MTPIISLVLLAGAIFLSSPASAEFARQEIVSIQSMTLSDNDFLQGKKEGKPVAIAGRLLLPKASQGAKQPAVILIHGSGGLGGSSGSVAEWEHVLTTAGIAVLTLDSFAGRGVVSTVADQSQLGRYNAILDAYRALTFLSGHRSIDARKIAIMGFSRGAQTSTYSNLERFWKSYGSSGRFAAHISFYAPCSWSLKDDNNVMAPMLFLHGMRMTGFYLPRAKNIRNG